MTAFTIHARLICRLIRVLALIDTKFLTIIIIETASLPAMFLTISILPLLIYSPSGMDMIRMTSLRVLLGCRALATVTASYLVHRRVPNPIHPVRWLCYTVLEISEITDVGIAESSTVVRSRKRNQHKAFKVPRATGLPKHGRLLIRAERWAA
jgi:hypothetical protein